MHLLNFPSNEEESWKMIQEISYNDRTMICWKNETQGTYNLCLFHFTDQPNELSQRSPYTSWGYVTYAIGDMTDERKAHEVFDLYMEDIVKNTAWWEKD